MTDLYHCCCLWRYKTAARIARALSIARLLRNAGAFAFFAGLGQHAVATHAAIASAASLVLLAPYSFAQSASPPALRPTELFRRASRAVVGLRVLDASGRRTRLGSGFVARDGRVVTNYHVILDADRIEILDAAGDLLSVAAFAESFDEVADLAILPRVSATMGALELSEMPPLIGEHIFVIGSPEGLSSTLSDGLVSGYRQIGDQKLMQITAPISPGSSGGPVLNEAGQIVGISVSSLRVGQNLNFAVPLQAIVTAFQSPPARRSFPKSRAEVVASSGDRNEPRDIENSADVSARLDHFSVTAVTCTRDSTATDLLCAVQFLNTDATGRSNNHLYVDAVRFADDLGVKSEAESAQLGGKFGRIRGWSEMIDDRANSGEKLLLVVHFSRPVPIGRKGTLTLHLGVGFGGKLRDLVIPDVVVSSPRR